MRREPGKRLPDEVFALGAEQIRSGHLSDKYFVRAQDILLADDRNPTVRMQVFCRSSATLCGVDEAIAILRAGVRNWENVTVHALYDGDRVEPWETVLTIEGAYRDFAQLETLYLGVLARGTRVATQTAALVRAANGKDVLFFGARHDHYRNQQSDGYAAFVGGAKAVATDTQGQWWQVEGVGTIPHALIAAYGGDTVLATRKFVEHMPPDVALVALVDFDNDCVGTSLAVADALGGRLRGVRLDTAAALIDSSLQGMAGSDLHGVNPTLVEKVRTALDEAGHGQVEIVVSGGVTAARIAEFEAANAAVNAYGVGSAVLRNNGDLDFTADIVSLDGKALSKVGRELRPNPRLQQVD